MMSAVSILSDSELLSLLREDNESAFSLIYNKYFQVIFTAAYNRLRDKEQCQDIVQNVFTSLWDRRKEQDINNLSAYLRTSVKFQVINYSTRKPFQSEFIEGFEELISSPIKTDDQLLEKEILNLIRLFVESMPEKRRNIYLLYYKEQLSTKEIADKLSISQKTVQNQLNKINNALKIRIGQFLMLAMVVSTHFKG